MRLRLAVLLAAVAALPTRGLAQLSQTAPQSAPVVAAGSTRARTLADHLGDEIKARNFGACVWDGAHDVAPCIQAAIGAAAAIGGAIVRLPAGHWPVASALTINASGVGLQGAGHGINRDAVNPYSFLSATSLVWTGAPGGTMLTVAPAGNTRLYKTDVLDLVLDCNGLAGTGLYMASTNQSTFRFGYSEPRTIGALFTTVGTLPDTQSPQDNDVTVVGRAILYPATGVQFDSTNEAAGNFSMNHVGLLRIWTKNGDAVVFASADNNVVDRVAVGTEPGGTGRPLVFGNHATGGGNAYSNRIGWFGGGTIAALGYQTGSTITPGGGNHGTGTAGALTVNGQATAGTYTLTATSATTFNVFLPGGAAASPATLTVGTAYGGDFGVTIAAGGTAFQAGDSFTVTVPSASHDNTVRWIDKANGNPDPIVEPGATLWWGTTFGQDVRRSLALGSGTLPTAGGMQIYSGTGNNPLTIAGYPGGTYGRVEIYGNPWTYWGAPLFNCSSGDLWNSLSGNLRACHGAGILGGLTTDTLTVATKTPASSSAACTAGQIAWDSGYVYICTGTNTWKRAALASW
jgi:hypothetical protein